MNTSTHASRITLALLLLLSACGGGGGGGAGGDNTTAINLIDWTWVGGSDTFGQPGSYGIKGSPIPANVSPPNAPQALEGAMSWAGASNNLWLFGGAADLGVGFNDLWKYDTINSQWTWMNGDATANQLSNYITKGIANPVDASGPGSREYSATWTDSSNNLWLFGGFVRINVAGSTAYANDLWKYDTNLRQWTWMNGSNLVDQPGNYGNKGTATSTNVPGARWVGTYWTDSGAFWLFGGIGFDSASQKGNLSDLWKYDTTNNLWTWMSGPSTKDQLGIYGRKGVADAANFPGARSGAVSWSNNGSLWLFGGSGLDQNGLGVFNDLWKYDTLTNQWTWMGGSNMIDQAGSYGSPGIPSLNNMPGSRRFGVSWKDNSGNFWLFGGQGYDYAGNFGELNDLWKFDGTNWTWMSGSKIRDQAGEYGTTGNTDPAKFVPGSRDVAVSWYDSVNSQFWLFGGQGCDVYANIYGCIGYLNDLWQFQPKP